MDRVLNGHDVDRAHGCRGENTDKISDHRIFQKRHKRSFSLGPAANRDAGPAEKYSDFGTLEHPVFMWMVNTAAPKPAPNMNALSITAAPFHDKIDNFPSPRFPHSHELFKEWPNDAGMATGAETRRRS
ncbi:hypothetical protein ACFQEX_07970 [Roseibium salinum]|uniref:hypothetical protein n=1 Tax=Roseibium salinum TaxID=1604349 RepID=UPI003610402C